MALLPLDCGFPPVSYTHLDVYKRQRWDYASGEELLALCEREHVTIAQAFRAREEALCAKQGTEAGIDAYLCLLYTSRCV